MTAPSRQVGLQGLVPEWETSASPEAATAALDAQVAATAALDARRAEFEAKGVAVKDGKWGYRLLVVDDPDGNQLLFSYPK